MCHYFGTGQRSIYRKQVGDFVTKKVIQNLFLEWVKRDGSKPHSWTIHSRSYLSPGPWRAAKILRAHGAWQTARRRTAQFPCTNSLTFILKTVTRELHTARAQASSHGPTALTQLKTLFGGFLKHYEDLQKFWKGFSLLETEMSTDCCSSPKLLFFWFVGKVWVCHFDMKQGLQRTRHFEASLNLTAQKHFSANWNETRTCIPHMTVFFARVLHLEKANP